MFRLIHLSDVHLDERRQLAGSIRLDEHGQNAALSNTVACLRAVRDAALADGPVDLWAITGDLFDTPTPTQLEERCAVEFVESLTPHAPVVVLAGNHDVPGAGSGATALECLKLRDNVTVVETPQVLVVSRGFHGNTVLASDDDVTEDDDTVTIACVPYPRRAELVALAPDGSREERNAAASAVLKDIIRGLRLESEERAPATAYRLALYHGGLDGAVVGVQPRSLSGDISVHPTDFAGFDYVAAGHIHKRQQLAPNVWYAGSVDRVDFDEEGDEKGALDVQLERGALTVEPIATPARRYVTLPLDAEPETLEPGVVYRWKGEATAAEAAELRRRVAARSGDAWVTTAVRLVAEVRARDAEARADETASALLGRWLLANPLHVDGVTSAHGAQREDVIADIVRLHHAAAGE